MLIHNRSVSNYTFHRNLCESVGQDFDADDIIVMHTVLGNQLIGLYLWYRDLPEPRPRLCLILRFPPGFHLPVENHDSAAGTRPAGAGAVAAVPGRPRQDRLRQSGIGPALRRR